MYPIVFLIVRTRFRLVACREFLIHAADVEGLCQGIDEELVQSRCLSYTLPCFPPRSPVHQSIDALPPPRTWRLGQDSDDVRRRSQE